MQRGNDDLKHSFYLRALRTGIGEALRDQFDLTEPMPDELLELLLELNEDEAPSEEAMEQAPKEARKP
jgi:hypothetical protein